MAIIIKTDEQLKLMAEANKIVAETHQLLEKYIKVGVTTKELDTIAEEFILSKGAKPNFKGYRGYEATICASVNEEIVHGIPSKRKLKDGDIISIDVGAYYKGYNGDAARTHAVGNVDSEVQRLIDVTRQSFFEGIKYAKLGYRLYEISGAIGDYIESNGFSIVRDYIGHGIGANLHEDPEIPNFRMPIKGTRLNKGMCLAIEPMVNMGTHKLDLLDDGWTAVTRDRKYSAHYENTIAITDGEPDILTLY